MENQINIAELLEDCPKGMELYSPIFGKVYLDKVRPHLGIVVATDKYKEEFLYDGRYGMNGECMIFPSKEKTTWEGFVPPCQFKDGDIVMLEDSSSLLVACIYKERKNTISFNHHIALYKGGLGIVVNGEIVLTNDKLCLATEEEKEKLFQAIKDNGYRWNEETKTLEKVIQPKFKVGDKIIHKINNEDFIYEISAVYDGFYGLVDYAFMLDMKYQDDYELVPDKFDVTTLVPFKSEVLVRDSTCSIWRPAIFGCIDNSACGLGHYYVLGGICWRYCIPYEGNEHLLGTANDCDDFYKTWE